VDQAEHIFELDGHRPEEGVTQRAAKVDPLKVAGRCRLRVEGGGGEGGVRIQEIVLRCRKT